MDLEEIPGGSYQTKNLSKKTYQKDLSKGLVKREFIEKL
jgi:hypothetical protein